MSPKNDAGASPVALALLHRSHRSNSTGTVPLSAPVVFLQRPCRPLHLITSTLSTAFVGHWG